MRKAGHDNENNNWQIAKNAFRDMFVAGVLGLFFITIVKDINKDWFPDGFSFSVDMAFRYAYLLFFLFYFFISNAQNKVQNADWRDIGFDVTQAVLGFNALYFLGFLSPDKPFFWCFNECQSLASGYFAANLAIFFIAAFSFIIYEREGRGSINVHRWWAIILSLLTAVFIFNFRDFISDVSYFFLVLSLVTLFVVMVFYFFKRMDGEDWKPKEKYKCPSCHRLI